MHRTYEVAGAHAFFRPSDGNNEMPTLEEFLRPLNIMHAAASSALYQDFLAMLMPPALLPQSAIGEFSASILKLLEQRFSFDVIAFLRG